MAIDPICGMEVDEAKGISAEQGGEWFYFCSPHCREKFLAPSSNSGATKAQIASDQAKHSADDTAIYTCPMHPEIEQTGAGSCPICGMDLEPKGIPTEDAPTELPAMTRRFWWAVTWTIPLLLLAMLPMVGWNLEAYLDHGWNVTLQWSLLCLSYIC